MVNDVCTPVNTTSDIVRLFLFSFSFFFDADVSLVEQLRWSWQSLPYVIRPRSQPRHLRQFRLSANSMQHWIRLQLRYQGLRRHHGRRVELWSDRNGMQLPERNRILFGSSLYSRTM